jgi:hypothetical protein
MRERPVSSRSAHRGVRSRKSQRHGKRALTSCDAVLFGDCAGIWLVSEVVCVSWTMRRECPRQLLIMAEKVRAVLTESGCVCAGSGRRSVQLTTRLTIGD